MEMNIDILVATIGATSDCVLFSPSGQPAIQNELQMPADLRRFYALCGGAILFTRSDFPIEIAAPSELEPSNLAILGKGRQEDRSDDWYAVARSGSDQVVSIDLNPQRLGRCYDSFWDRHAVAGSCAIVAMNFCEFVRLSLEAEGRELYWTSPGFKSYGDAHE